MWLPIGFSKKYQLFEESHPFISWLFLAVVIFVVNFILYLIMQYVHNVPPFITSLVIGSLFAIIVEWIIYDLPAELYSFKKLSIPFRNFRFHRQVHASIDDAMKSNHLKRTKLPHTKNISR